VLSTIHTRPVIFVTENTSVTFQVEQLQENCQRLNQQNSELEQLFKDALTENRKLQDSIDTLKLNSDKQHQELQVRQITFMLGSHSVMKYIVTKHEDLTSKIYMIIL
jgi:predicted nuclease with TOPRIM domain